jgi:hypothetical protein
MKFRKPNMCILVIRDQWCVFKIAQVIYIDVLGWWLRHLSSHRSTKPVSRAVKKTSNRCRAWPKDVRSFSLRHINKEFLSGLSKNLKSFNFSKTIFLGFCTPDWDDPTLINLLWKQQMARDSFKHIFCFFLKGFVTYWGSLLLKERLVCIACEQYHEQEFFNNCRKCWSETLVPF